MKTSCEHCIFKINTGKVQTGCQLDRLVKYDAELVGSHYEFDGYCNFCRNCYSDTALSDNPIAEVKKECEVKYAVIYQYDGNDGFLEQTLKSCAGIYEPYDVVVCYNDKIDMSITELHNKFQPIFNKLCVTQSINDDMNWYDMYEMAMKKTKADYIYFCDAGEKIDKNCLSQLNSLINDDVKTVYMIVNNNFTIVYKKLFEKFAHLEFPMKKLHDSLMANDKYKDTVIKW